MNKTRLICALMLVSMLFGLTGCGWLTLDGNKDGEPSADTSSHLGSAVKRYEITFDLNGGTLDSGSLSQRVKPGELPAAPSATRTGYELSGWEPALAPADGNAEYTAKWTLATYDPEDLFAMASPAVAEITVYDSYGDPMSLGSGFFIDGEGTLVTNYHVIEGGCSAVAATADGRQHDVITLLAFDSMIDLAVLAVDIQGNDYLRIRDGNVRTGESIYAIGSSLGLTNTFSSGIVSTASREQDGIAYIQITAPISHGNSGGPLMDVHGQVVGVNTMTLTEGQNLNFAVNIHELDKLDRSDPMTLEEYYDEIGSYVTGAVSEQLGYFYDETDYAEVETNDSILLADAMPDGEWIAGELPTTEDADWFYIEVEEPCTVRFEVVPYYTSDDVYLRCGVVGIGEEDFELIEVLDATDELSFEIEDYCDVSFDEPGLYFLLVMMSDDYDYSEPLYYMARTTR